MHKIHEFLIVHVGDLVDRRPNSKGVLDYMIRGHDEGRPWVTLKGNHDRLFEWFLKHPERKDPILRPDYTWLHPRMGGRDTLASYGVSVDDDYDLMTLHDEALKTVPKAHLEFALEKQTEDDLLWIRQEFHKSTQMHPKIVVHGHTPVDNATHYGNRINIDTGAAYERPLSTILISPDGVFLLDGSGRSELATQDGLGS